MNDVEKFDPSRLMEGVKERIKATFVSLIPDKQWEKMVKKEIDAFFEPQNVSYSIKTSRLLGGRGYTENEAVLNMDSKESPFRRMVWEEAVKKTNKMLSKYLTDEYFNDTYPISEQNTKDGMKSIMESAIPVAMANFFKAIAFNSQNQLRDEINNMGRY